MANIDINGRIRLQDAFSGTFDQLNKKVSGLGGAFSGISSSLSALMPAAGLAGLAFLSKDAVSLAMDLEEVKGSFDALTNSAGISGRAMLASLTTASRGMTSQLNLMKSANRALLSDNRVITSSLDTIYKAAAAGADALGLSTTEAFDRIVQGISVMQSRSLKEFGINVDAIDANKAFAASMDIAVGSMTQAQKEAAFATAAVKEMRDILDRTGDSALSTADKADQLAAKWSDLKAVLGTALIQAGIGDLFAGVTLQLGQTTAEIAFYQARLDRFGLGGFPAAMQEFNTLAGQAGGDLEKLTRLLEESTAALPPMTSGMAELAGALDRANTMQGLLRESFNRGEITWETYREQVDLVNFALGNLGKTMADVSKIHLQLAPLSPGYTPRPFMDFGKPPAGFGLSTSDAAETTAWFAEREAEAAEREVESKRRTVEYQGVYNDRLADAQRIMEATRSDAERVLTAGTNVTQGDVLATQAGTYQDKPLEAARRLEDIANRGMDSPWAKILVPPAEVIAQGSAAVKAWAASTKADVLDLSRPDLINWEAFVTGFDQMKQKEAAKGLTLDIAIGKLDEAGLLSGVSETDRKKQVAKALGIDTGMFTGLNLGADLVGTLNSDFKANEAGFKTVGKAAGNVTSGAFLEAIKGNVGNLLDVMVGMLAPPVSTAVAEMLRGTGPAQ